MAPDNQVDVPRSCPAPVDGIRVGIGGWTYAPWRNNFYPTGLVQRRELEYASRQLNTIEVNGTFHRAQTPATYAKWRDEAPHGFVFSAKAPMRIVQSRVLAKTGYQVEDFVGAISTLGEKLGPLVWQFEGDGRIDRADFQAFLDLLPGHADGRPLRHVIDMRDPAMVDADLVTLLRQRGLASVYTDSSEHPSFADITADFIYARLMRAQSGLDTGYPHAALQAWAQRAKTWAAGDAPADLATLAPVASPARRREVFVYFIGAAKERNPAAAVALLQALGALH